MDNQKKCGVGKICWNFEFVHHSTKFNSTIGEGFTIGHHMLQPIHHQIDSLRSSDFHHKKDND
jgi:hypothetical protein